MRAWAARRDKAEPAIVKALQAVGAKVVKLSAKDMPDLLVGWKGATFLLEVKTHHEARVSKRVKADGSLAVWAGGTTATSAGQEKWHATWRGGPVTVVHTPDEALAAIGASGALRPAGPPSVNRSQAPKRVAMRCSCGRELFWDDERAAKAGRECTAGEGGHG